MKINSIFFLPDAEDDIFNIYKYNDKNYSSKNALETIKEIKTTISNLKNYPNIGNIPPELERIDIYEYREVHFSPYRIIYKIIGENIYIHCILDSRRDIRSLLMERFLN